MSLNKHVNLKTLNLSRFALWCLTSHATIFQLYRGVQFLLEEETGTSRENH